MTTAPGKKINSRPRNKRGKRSDPSPGARLYLDFYNLTESPFSITPDPEFLYMSSSHRTVMEKILYGIHARMGFLLLIGEVGAGKTTLCRTILDELTGKAETAYIINPSLSGIGLIESILDDLGVEHSPTSSKKELLDLLNRFLLTTPKEKPVVIIIDDAQTMTVEGLETLRLLSNLETDKEKLIQLVLVGQQELLDILSKPEMRQLQQRIAIRCRLDLLKETDLQGYISHRLFVAGDKGNIQFSPDAIRKIFRASSGIPRLINKICDYSLIAGYVSNSLVIEKNHIKRAIDEMEDDQQKRWRPYNNIAILSLFQKRNFFRLGVTSVCILLLLAYFIFNNPARTNGSTPTRAAGISQTHAAMPHSPVKVSQTQANKDVLKNNEKAPLLTEGIRLKQTQITQASSDHNSYILQVASYKTPEDAMRAVAIYSEKGIDVHWNAIEGREQTIYRVYAGRFSTKEAAEEFQRTKGLSVGVIAYAPWTIQTAVLKNKTELNDRCRAFKEIGIDYLINGDEESGFRIMSGAFKTQDSAKTAISKLIKGGIDATVVFE